MRSSWISAAAVATFCTAALAQTIDPNSVPLATRDQWCQSQMSECPLICLQEAGNSAATYSNTCDAADLTYSCVCSNGLSPNASEYSQTIPYYICTQYNTNCVAGCGSDNTCASACRQDHPCGAQSPTRVNTSTITNMPSTTTSAGAAASTASDGVIYTGFGGSAATTAAGDGSSGGTHSAATRLVLNVGQMYGLGIVAAGIFAGFTLLL